jgi:hypothetical protein
MAQYSSENECFYTLKEFNNLKNAIICAGKLAVMLMKLIKS